MQPVDRAAPDLTEEERKLLHAHLATNDSDKKYFVKLIAAIGNQEPRIRAAALKAVRQLLTTNPSLANQKAVACLQRVLRKTNTHQGVNHALQVLDWVVATNPKMAPSVLKLALDPATLNLALRIVRGDWAKGSDHTPLRTLLRTLVKARPDCKQHILKYVFKRGDLQDILKRRALFDSYDDDRDNNVAMRALGILSFIADMEEPGTRDFSKMFDTALQASQAVNRYIRSMGVAVFRKVLHTDTQYAKELLATLIQEAQHTDWNTRRHALKALHTFVRADAQYIEALLTLVFQALYDLLSSETVDNPWNALHILDSSTIEIIIETNLANHVQEVFKSVMQLVQHKDVSVRCAGVDALACFIRPDRQYASTALEAVQQVAIEDEYQHIRQHALGALAAVVEQDAQYAPQAFVIAQQALQNSDDRGKLYAVKVLVAVVYKVPEPEYMLRASAIMEQVPAWELFEAVVHNNADYALQAFEPAWMSINKDTDSIAPLRSLKQALSVFAAVVRSNPNPIYATRAVQVATKAVTINEEDFFHVLFMSDISIDVRIKALEVLAAAVNNDAQYAPQAFKAARQAMKDRNVEVRKQVLAVLEAVVKKDAQYAQKAGQVAIEATSRRDLHECYCALRVLEAVMASHEQYAQDQALREVLEALSHDEAPQLHQFAHKLLLQYFLKEGESQ